MTNNTLGSTPRYRSASRWARQAQQLVPWRGFVHGLFPSARRWLRMVAPPPATSVVRPCVALAITLGAVFFLPLAGSFCGPLAGSTADSLAGSVIGPWVDPLFAASVPVAAAAEPAPVPAGVNELLAKYCGECHGKETPEGGVSFTELSRMEQSGLLTLLGKAQEQIAVGLMPPKDAEQPTDAQRRQVTQWISTELRKHNLPTIDDKLKLPNHGNLVDHDMLFSGAIPEQPFTPARRWLVSPQIFWERVFDALRLEDREKQNYRAGGLYGVTNPFTLPERSGVRDYDLTAVDGGHFLVMQTNAAWMADKVIGAIRVKLGEPIDKVFENRADRWFPQRGAIGSKSWAFDAFETLVRKDSPPTDEELSAAIRLQFAHVLQRPPTDLELQSYLALTRSATELGGNVEGLRKMLVAVILESEFVYRLEFGSGEPDEHGRRRLSPREASYAIAYALGDQGPDAALVEAAQDGRLATKADYEREVRRLLAHGTHLKGPVDPVFRVEHNEAFLATPLPKMVRFFREFFGYPMAVRVFKDVERGDGLYRVPDRGTYGTPGFLVVEADRVVARIVEQDRDVFANLLTTDQFFVYHNLDNEKGEQRIEGWRKVYETLKDTDWRGNPEQVAKDHAELLARHVAPGIKGLKGKVRSVHETDLARIMTLFEATFGRGGRPFTTFPWAHGNRFWHSPFYNLPRTPREGEYDRDGVFDYHPVQPFTVPQRKGILTHPAWLIAHSQNAATDPIRRGKWIREKLLAGAVPDLPITVDAQLPEHPDKSLRERLALATRKQECWKCHQHMNPLGLAFEMYDDFGRFRTEEKLEHPANLLAKAKGKDGADTYKTAPLVSTGSLDGTGDPALDGEVRDAFDLIDRLAKSTRVRQSIIRHAFRFYLGRNELPSDSKTLIDADHAYVRSGGSFQAVVVSLLTSDSFLYRK